MKTALAFLLTIVVPFTAFCQQGPGWGIAQPPAPEEVAAWAESAPEEGSGRSIDGRNLNPAPGLNEHAAARSLSEASAPVEPPMMLMSLDGNEADEITPEIEQLAQGLLNDPVKIYEYVRNRIDFEAYYGCKKGAHLTLLEGSGNDFDQSALLVALLRAAGFSPSYQFGPCSFVYEELVTWMGLSSTPYSHMTDTQFRTHFGLPIGTNVPRYRKWFAVFEFVNPRGYFYVEPYSSGGYEFFVLPHVWVELEYEGDTYQLSPSRKDYTTTAGINLATATGYSRSQILSDAGGSTSGSTWVSDLNYANIASRLSTYSNNFRAAIKSSYDHLAPEQLTTQRKIGYASFSSLDEADAIFPDEFAAETWLPFETWTEIPSAQMSKLRITIGDRNYSTNAWTGATYYDQTVTMPSLQGKKISLSYSGNTGRIYLDETLIGSTFSIPGAQSDVDMRLEATHNHYTLVYNSGTDTYTSTNQGRNNQAEVKPYLKGNDYAYSIVYSFANADRLARKRQEQLDEYNRAGITDWRMKTELLNVLGLNWLYQSHQASQVIMSRHNISGLLHHCFGRVADEGSFYIDVGLSFSSNIHRGLNFGTSYKANYLDAFFASAMEHGVIEQMQGGSAAATSTVEMIYRANEADQRIYRATSSNWSTVNSELQNYPNATKTSIGNDVQNNGGKALLPRSGQITLNSYTGLGYALELPASVQMIIDENFGGYSTTGTLNGQAIINHFQSSPVYTSGNTGISYTPYTTPQLRAADPVDMYSGAWVADQTDLVIGRTAPRGLAFSRHYNSNSRYDNSKGMGYGWTHSYDIRLTERSSVKAGLGKTITYHAAPFYTALEVASDLYFDHTSAKEWATAALVVHWAVEQLKYNAVAITSGNRTLEFVKMPDGTFIPPAGINASLTKAGSVYSMTERNGPTLAFNSSHRANTLTDLYGKTLTFAYSGNNLSTVTDAYGRALTFSWSGNKIASVTDNASRSIGFGYTSDNLTTFTDAESKSWTYGYDGEHRVTSVTDPSSRVVVENEYDTESRVTVQRNQGDVDRTYNLYYTGLVNTEEDPLGGRKRYFYDERGRSIGTVNAIGSFDTIVYDGQDRRTIYLTPKGERTDYIYDSDNNLVQTEDAEGEYVDYWYDNQHRLEEIWDEELKVTLFTYNTKHQLLTKEDPLSNTITNTYNGDGELLTVTDAENNTTTYGYDARGHVNLVTYADSTTQAYTNNTLGDVTSSTDPEGNVTSFTYNNRRQTLTVTAPGSAVTTNTYDNEGLLASSTDPRGNTVSFTYSATGKPATTTQSTLPAGNNVITNTYDVRDWLEEVGNSLGETLGYTYDAAGQATETSDSLNRATLREFDSNGRLVKTTDPLSRVTRLNYTDRGELSGTRDALLEDTTFLYDPRGNQTQREDRRGKLYEFGYDDANRQTSLKTPLNRITSTVHDGNGLPETITEPSGQITTLAYDNRNRVETKTDAVGTITYGYDNNGNLETVTQGAVTLTRAYDNRNRVESFTNHWGQTIGYEYDKANNLTKIIYPGGKEVVYAYNSRNLLETVTDWDSRVTTYSYDRTGRLTGITRPNGTTASYSYDAAGQLIEHREASPSKLFFYRKFGYDQGGQVASEFTGPLPKGYDLPSKTATYDDDNRLATFNSLTVTHDADGNMTSGPLLDDNLVTYTYNARNQLTAAGTRSYTYDAEGVRISSTEAGQTTKYTIDPTAGLSRLLIKENPDTSLTYYVYGYGLLYEVNESEDTRTYHYNSAGSTSALTNDIGAVTGRVEYSPYGDIVYRTGDTETPFLYNGRYGVITDANGLMHMRARYYNPYIQRFLNADPIGFSGSPNWFSYADGNPISKTDPLGTWAETAWDIANIGIGVYSLQDNIRNKKWGWAVLDGVGLAYDAVATAVPFLPAGASAGMKALRAGNTVADSAAVAHDIAVVSDATHDVARTYEAASTPRWQAARDGVQIHREVATKVDGKLLTLDSTFMTGANRATGRQPDLIGSNLWGDITTPKQWSDHLTTYTSSHGSTAIPVFYQRGVGVVGTTQLHSGAGTALWATQQIYNSLK